jgi:RNA polymerase sigma-70 factor (ECF subfamily)
MSIQGRERVHPPGAAAPDQQLAATACAESAILRAARDNPALFEPIYNRYFARIYAYCCRRVNTPQEAEDLTSIIFTRALGGLDSYRGGSVAAWLFRIARNATANYHRDHRPTISLDDEPIDIVDSRPEPAERFMHTEECARLRALVADLPTEAQEIVTLRIYAGLTSAEIGAIVGKRAGAVRMKLHRILKRLGAHLNEEST